MNKFLATLVPPCLQGTRAALWMSLVSILAKLGTLQMEQLRNQALVILQRSVSVSCKLYVLRPVRWQQCGGAPSMCASTQCDLDVYDDIALGFVAKLRGDFAGA